MTATDYRIRYGTIATPPPEHLITWAGSRQQQGRIPAFSRRGNREVSMVLMVEGTTLDDMLNNFNAFDEMMQESTRYFQSGGAQAKKARLTIRPDGATNTSELTVVGGQIDPGEWGTVITTRYYRLFCPVTLVCLPFAEEAADVTSTSNNQVNTGISVTLSAVRGVVETPLKISLATDGSPAPPALFFAARRSRGTVANFLYILRGETGAHTGHTVTDIGDADWTYSTQAAVGTATNDAFGRQGTTAGVAGDRLLRWAITANLPDHYGQFRVWMRAKAQGAQTRAYRLYGGTVTTPLTATADVSLDLTTAWTMYDMGSFQWPDMALPADVTVANLILELAYADANGTADIDVDHILLVPIDEGYMTGILTGASLAVGDKVVIDGRSVPPAVYVTNSSNQVRTDVSLATLDGSFPTLAPGDNRLFFYFDEQDFDLVINTIDVVMTYRPRYTYLRGA